MANKVKELAGSKILKARVMTEAEMKREGWDGHNCPPLVLELDNGLHVYASQDDEGNGPGALFGIDTETNASFWFGASS